MVGVGSDTTCQSLLYRVRTVPTDEGAWQEFVQRYEPRIRSFCLTIPLQAADADDVAQTVLLKMVRRMRDFEYDPAGSFRAWLRTVINNALADFLDERRRRSDGIVPLLEGVVAMESLAREVEEEFDRELLEAALADVRQRVPASQWEAFRMTSLDGLSGAEAAQRLGMPVATVYTAKSKVRKLVREAVMLADAEVNR
ncbi:MAG: sigma-70 family RNA polymerase sigma factor [Planctomycetia bacterium]|nr:sigma-70 family RNA polymerase sigma factor [Planctomycetia bacterium]